MTYNCMLEISALDTEHHVLLISLITKKKYGKLLHICSPAPSQKASSYLHFIDSHGTVSNHDVQNGTWIHSSDYIMYCMQKLTRIFP